MCLLIVVYSSFEGWKVSRVKSGSVIIPDVSRVLRRPSDFFHFSPKDTRYQLFALPRETNRYLKYSLLFSLANYKSWLKNRTVWKPLINDCLCSWFCFNARNITSYQLRKLIYFLFSKWCVNLPTNSINYGAAQLLRRNSKLRLGFMYS